MVKTRNVRIASRQEAAVNKRRQLILKRGVNKNLKVDGSWGPWQQQLWDQYVKKHPEVVHAYFDLAPTVAFGNTNDKVAWFEPHRDDFRYKNEHYYNELQDYQKGDVEYNLKLNNKYYNQVMDSISKRKKEGFYKQIPSQYDRDLNQTNQYKNNPGTGQWSCIKSVTGLRGPTEMSNSNFKYDTHKSLNYRDYGKIPKQFWTPGDVIQNLNYGHSVLYLGDNDYYDTHGFVAIKTIVVKVIVCVG